MSKIAYFINTHKNYFDSTIPIIGQSILDNNINVKDVFLFVNEAQQREYSWGGFNIVPLFNNSYEYGGLFHYSFYPEKYAEYEYVVSLQDTVKFGSEFAHKLANKISPHFDVNCIFSTYSNNCIYSRKFLSGKWQRDFFLSYLCCSKIKTVNCEHLFFDLCEPARRNIINVYPEYKSPFKYPGSDVVRFVNYYPELDLYKMIANWGRTDIFLP
jgi:hypothetical protein